MREELTSREVRIDLIIDMQISYRRVPPRVKIIIDLKNGSRNY